MVKRSRKELVTEMQQLNRMIEKRIAPIAERKKPVIDFTDPEMASLNRLTLEFSKVASQLRGLGMSEGNEDYE